MGRIKILTEADLRETVELDVEAVNVIEDAFASLAGGKVVMPPILSMAIKEHNGEVDVKTAYVPGLDSFAIKVSPGFFDNPKKGLPSTSGLMVLFSAHTGMVEALLFDNGYLTDVRTAAAGAVAARHLAKEDATTACIVGTGTQARMQLAALCLVRPIRSATIWGRDEDKAARAAQQMQSALGIEIRTGGNLERLVSDADIVITTTPATKPVLKARWLRPGHHITAMGSDQHNKNELDPACIAKADLYVPDRLSQVLELGELRAAIDAGIIEAGAEFPELGFIISGEANGRASDSDITIADLTGTGVQDTAIANFARMRAQRSEAGTDFDN